MLWCQRHPPSNAFQGEPLADSCIISWPRRPVLQGTWGGLWLHAQNTNPISTCVAGICYTKLEINNSSRGMNNSTEGTKGCWHNKAAHGAFQRERGRETLQPGWCLDPKDPDTRQFRLEHKESMGALGLPEGNSGPYLPPCPPSPTPLPASLTFTVHYSQLHWHLFQETFSDNPNQLKLKSIAL